MFHLSLVEPLKNLAVLIVLILCVNWLGIKALALGYILSTLFVGIILIKPFLNVFPSRENIVEFWPLFKKLILFGLPVILTAVGGELISYFDTFALTYFRSLEEVGIYQVIMPTATMVLMLGRSLAITIYPMISEYWAKKQYYVVQNGLRLFYKLVPWMIIPLIIGIFLVRPFLGFFFGASYLPGVLALQILLVGVFFYFVAMINTHALAAIGLPKENAKLILTGGLINVVLNIILIPTFGIEGAAFATAIAYIWIMVRSISKVKRFILNVQPNITTV